MEILPINEDKLPAVFECSSKCRDDYSDGFVILVLEPPISHSPETIPFYVCFPPKNSSGFIGKSALASIVIHDP